MSEEIAFLMTDALRDVVERGTGWRARALGRPSAGKTGTTNKSVDAWYIGYIPQLLAGVYVGYDSPRPMGKTETGSQAASPIWLDFMKDATANLKTGRFIQPPTVVTTKTHRSGRRAVPCDPPAETYNEHFIAGSEPPIDQEALKFCEAQQEKIKSGEDERDSSSSDIEL